MINKIVIKDNKNSPIHYLSELKTFKNGKEYIFKEGVNIIVGENGSGKTTLLNLIRKYLLVDDVECSKGIYDSNINALYKGLDEKEFYDGVSVYADYKRNTFRLCHAGEKSEQELLKNFDNFKEFITQKSSSTGECVVVALKSLLRYIFSSKVNLLFNYSQFEKSRKKYFKYTQEHTIEGDEWTILMDEPDRNLSLENIQNIKNIFSFHKQNTQVIAVIHNPLLIYSLSKNKDINFIEMNKGYIKKVKTEVENLFK
jgi:predicted ATPase